MKRAALVVGLALTPLHPVAAQTLAGDEVGFGNCMSAAAGLSVVALAMLNGDADTAARTPRDLLFELEQRQAGLTTFSDAPLVEVFGGDAPLFAGVLAQVAGCMETATCRSAEVLPEVIALSQDLQSACIAAFLGN